MPVGWLASRGATSQFNHREEFVFDISSIRYQLGSLPGWDRAAGSHPRLGGPVSSPLSYTSKKCENVAGQDWSSHHTSHSYCLSCKRNTFTPRQTCPCYNSLWLGLRTWRQGEVIGSYSHAVCVPIVGRVSARVTDTPVKQLTAWHQDIAQQSTLCSWSPVTTC